MSPIEFNRLVRSPTPPKSPVRTASNVYLEMAAPGRGYLFYRCRYNGHDARADIGPIHRYSQKDGEAIGRMIGQFVRAGLNPWKARDTALRVHAGFDPAVALAQVTKPSTPTTTATDAFPAFRTAKIDPVGRKQREQYVLLWQRNLEPILGGMDVAEVGSNDVLRALEPLWLAHPELGKRARSLLERFFDYCTARGQRSGENPAALRRLKSLLPTHKKADRHLDALPPHLIPVLMANLRNVPRTLARAAEFCVLTACRSGEVRGATWREIDCQNRVWTIPASRMKAGKEHRVPLSDAALTVLDQMGALRTGDDALIFPGKARAPIVDTTLTRVAQACAPEGVTTTLHGLRSSFRDWAGEFTAYPREVVEMALAHRLGDKTEQAYARGDLFTKRRRLMQDWAEFCGRAGYAEGASAVPPIRAEA